MRIRPLTFGFEAGTRIFGSDSEETNNKIKNRMSGSSSLVRAKAVDKRSGHLSSIQTLLTHGIAFTACPALYMGASLMGGIPPLFEKDISKNTLDEEGDAAYQDAVLHGMALVGAPLLYGTVIPSRPTKAIKVSTSDEEKQNFLFKTWAEATYYSANLAGKVCYATSGAPVLLYMSGPTAKWLKENGYPNIGTGVEYTLNGAAFLSSPGGYLIAKGASFGASRAAKYALDSLGINSQEYPELCAIVYLSANVGAEAASDNFIDAVNSEEFQDGIKDSKKAVLEGSKSLGQVAHNTVVLHIKTIEDLVGTGVVLLDGVDELADNMNVFLAGESASQDEGDDEAKSSKKPTEPTTKKSVNRTLLYKQQIFEVERDELMLLIASSSVYGTVRLVTEFSYSFSSEFRKPISSQVAFFPQDSEGEAKEADQKIQNGDFNDPCLALSKMGTPINFFSPPPPPSNLDIEIKGMMIRNL